MFQVRLIIAVRGSILLELAITGGWDSLYLQIVV